MNKTIRSLDTETNDHEWLIDPSLAFSGGISADYFFGNHIGLSIGIGYGQFSTTYSLHGNYQQDFFSFTTKNNLPFYKHIDAVIDSTVRLSYIQFPVQLIGLTNKPQKTGLYCKAGVIASILMNGKYEYKGNLSYWGWFPGIDKDTVNLPEFGFYEKSDHSGDVDLNQFFLSGIFSIGLNIPLAYFTTIQIGPVIHASFTDLSKKTDYIDIFGIKYAHKPVSLNYLGLEISIRFL
jgi:hypothetical protein